MNTVKTYSEINHIYLESKKMTAAERNAHNQLKKQSTSDLMIQWALTEAAPISPELTTVRGWLMDEMERRNPAAFDAWLDAMDEDPDVQPDKFFEIEVASK